MSFTAQDVKTLRERTGCGMMDCKNALVETNGDMEKAIDFLREKGMAKAAKKAGRIAAEGIVDSYIHMGGKIGVLVQVEGEADAEALHDVALQIAAAKPSFVSKEEVPSAELEHEKEILLAQAIKENEELPENKRKPQQIIEKMLMGRLTKELKEICLLEQVYVKAADGKQTVAQYLADVAKQNGADLSIRGFVRYETGEGIEKRVDDFAAEVMAQANA